MVYDLLPMTCNVQHRRFVTCNNVAAGESSNGHFGRGAAAAADEAAPAAARKVVAAVVAAVVVLLLGGGGVGVGVVVVFGVVVVVVVVVVSGVYGVGVSGGFLLVSRDGCGGMICFLF